METLRGIWRALQIIGGIVVVLMVATILLAVFGQPTVAVAVASAVLMLFELLVILGSFTLGCMYAKGLMISGAEIGIRVQESDDDRDIRMIKGVTDLADTVLRAARSGSEPPPPPMPQQSWLPPSLETPRLTDGSIDGEFKIN